jgi:hypothetical protein
MTADRAVGGVVLVVLGLLFLLPISGGLSALTHTVGIGSSSCIQLVAAPGDVIHTIGHGVHSLTRLIVPAALIGLGLLVRRAV